MDSYKDDYTVDSSIYEGYKKCEYIRDDKTGKRRKSYLKASVKYCGRGILNRFYHPKTIEVRLDSGADTSMFDKDTAKDLFGGFPEYDPKSVTFVIGVGGRVCVGTIQYLDIEVCGITFDDVPVVFPVDPITEICEYLRRVHTKTAQKRYPLTRYRLNSNLLGWEGFLERLLTSLDSESAYLFKRRTNRK